MTTTLAPRWADPQYVETVHQIVDILSRARLSTETEKRLQADMALRFDDAFLDFEREVPVAGGIIDFLIRVSAVGEPNAIGIEVKISGAANDVFRQIDRYAADPRIASFVLVTAKPLAIPPLIGGKPVVRVQLGRAWL